MCAPAQIPTYINKITFDVALVLAIVLRHVSTSMRNLQVAELKQGLVV
jgi:hypothetical protein